MKQSIIFISLFLVTALISPLSTGCKKKETDPAETVEERAVTQEPVKREESEKNDTKGAVRIYYFYGKGCPSCEKTREIVDRIFKKPGLKGESCEVWYDEKNKAKLLSMAGERNRTVKGVPVVIIGNDVYAGVKEISALEGKIGQYIK